MRGLIPYGVALLALYGTAARSIAAQVHARWLADRGIHPLPAYGAVLSTVACAGGWYLGIGAWLPDGAAAVVVALAVGGGTGVAAVVGDRWCVHQCGKRRRAPYASYAPSSSTRSRPAGAAAGHEPAEGGRWGIPLARERWYHWARSAAGARWGPGGLTTLAVLEELVYRGVLSALCLRLPAPPAAVALAAVTVAFGLSHAYGGWPQALAKSVVGALFLGAAATATLLAAVTAHVLFNLAACFPVHTGYTGAARAGAMPRETAGEGR
ncbi:CPBP family intramembrane metalloprotease [Streptomyces sp. HC44]|uniref:CPBP family intramembrane metalloprotease n=1 Tax=Streptomyces scabichelini TaxID=2711217 RepID=A0A6G4UZ08_9ACTN|nr:CPBP family glutamic-type intramembrane protease [Streptomyces scabichelini]NGO07012.1 CPBP family intramembrane metalloprotease [Streptomyces scabichelini]